VIRLLTIFLFFIHTLTQAGTVLSAHYCMGDLAGVSWGEEKHPGCSFCGMKSKSCCHDDVMIIKTENHAYQVQIIKAVEQFQSVAIISNQLRFPDHSFDATVKSPLFNYFCSEGPPLYLKNCVFRI
jgi:hypothetical protein